MLIQVIAYQSTISSVAMKNVHVSFRSIGSYVLQLNDALNCTGVWCVFFLNIVLNDWGYSNPKS